MKGMIFVASLPTWIGAESFRHLFFSCVLRHVYCCSACRKGVRSVQGRKQKDEMESKDKRGEQEQKSWDDGEKCLLFRRQCRVGEARRGEARRGEARGFPWPPPWPSVTRSVRASQTVWLRVTMTNLPVSQTLSGQTAWHLNCSNELSNSDAKEDVKDRHRRTAGCEQRVKKQDVWLSYWL